MSIMKQALAAANSSGVTYARASCRRQGGGSSSSWVAERAVGERARRGRRGGGWSAAAEWMRRAALPCTSDIDRRITTRTQGGSRPQVSGTRKTEKNDEEPAALLLRVDKCGGRNGATWTTTIFSTSSEEGRRQSGSSRSPEDGCWDVQTGADAIHERKGGSQTAERKANSRTGNMTVGGWKRRWARAIAERHALPKRETIQISDKVRGQSFRRVELTRMAQKDGMRIIDAVGVVLWSALLSLGRRSCRQFWLHWHAEAGESETGGSGGWWLETEALGAREGPVPQPHRKDAISGDHRLSLHRNCIVGYNLWSMNMSSLRSSSDRFALLGAAWTIYVSLCPPTQKYEQYHPVHSSHRRFISRKPNANLSIHGPGAQLYMTMKLSPQDEEKLVDPQDSLPGDIQRPPKPSGQSRRRRHIIVAWICPLMWPVTTAERNHQFSFGSWAVLGQDSVLDGCSSVFFTYELQMGAGQRKSEKPRLL
ncbi:hypothetical protein BJ912DRAFT_925384 [Pholiota molesta]|nr:hypothetical protein BJ912DRAFT_925384 [Pholiota molesta]